MATRGAVVDPDLLKFQSQQKKSGTGLDGSRFQCSGMQWFWVVQSSLTFGVRCCCSLPSFRCRRVARLSPPWRLKVSFRLGASPAPARQLSYRSRYRGMPLGCGPHLAGLLCERFPALPFATAKPFGAVFLCFLRIDPSKTALLWPPGLLFSARCLFALFSKGHREMRRKTCLVRQIAPSVAVGTVRCVFHNLQDKCYITKLLPVHLCVGHCRVSAAQDSRQ